MDRHMADSLDHWLTTPPEEMEPEDMRFMVTIKRAAGFPTSHPFDDITITIHAESEDDAEQVADDFITRMDFPPHSFEIDAVTEL